MPDEGTLIGNPEGELDAEVAKQSVELLIALNAAMVNIHMYPSTSDMIGTSIEAGYDRISRILARTIKLSLGEANNLLLVNGIKLGEKDQARPPVVAFLTSLRRRDVFSITISDGLTIDEFRSFLEVMADEPERLRDQGGLTEALRNRQVENILVNERRYISVRDDEEVSTVKEEEEERRVEDALAKLRQEEIQRLTEKLKDERFIGYVLGKDTLEDLGEEALADIMGNPPRMGILLRQAIREIVAEIEDPVPALEAILIGLEKIAVIIAGLKQSELESMDAAELCKAIGFLEPSELKEYLLSILPDTLTLLNLRRQILENLRETKVLDLLENAIREHDTLKSSSGQGELSPESEARYQALSALIDEIYASSVGKPWEAAVSDRIFQADMWKKISESREAGGEAGSSTLVYQISNFLVSEGLGLDIDEVSGLTIDESIPRLIEKLYRTNHPEAAEKLVRNLLENLNDMSPEIRLKTAQTLQKLPEVIQMTRTIQEAALAHELKGQLLQRLEKERELDEIYGALTVSLATMAERFALGEDYGAAIEIIDTFWRHRSPSEMRKPEQQKLAMEAVESIASPELLEGLADVLREGNIETITEVANILIKFENKSVQPLIQVLKDSDDILVRKVTFDALEYIGKDAIKTLINDLERYDPWHMYRNIISILAEIGNRSIISSLSRFINHQNPEVRRETIKAVGRIQSSETITLLLEGLKDRDDVVQRECCLALGRIGDISTTPELLEIIKPARNMRYKRAYAPGVRAAAIWALGQIGDYSSVPEISRLLKKKPWLPLKKTQASEVRQEAARALASIGAPESVEVLTRCSADRDEKVSRACQEGLRLLQVRQAQARA